MISDLMQARFAREVAKYPKEQRQSAVLACLAIVQQEHGHITKQAEQEVANYLDMPLIAVHEVATFYSMFNLKSVGKYKLSVCTNISCQLAGALEALKSLEEKLGISLGQTTQDGKFTLEQCECLGACADAPVMLVNDRTMCSHMHTKRAINLIDDLSDATSQPEGEI